MSDRCDRCGGFCEHVQPEGAAFPSVACDPAMRAAYAPCKRCGERTTVLWATLRANGATTALCAECANRPIGDPGP